MTTSSTSSGEIPVPAVRPGAEGWRIVAPSRLHFGLLGFRDSAYSFGGAGVMIDLPAAIVEVTQSDALLFSGTASSRTKSAALSWSESTGRALGDLQVNVGYLAERHVGLGSGTQLAMAVGEALFRSTGEMSTSVERLARSVGRGERSSVGSLGFAHGGFIFEHGHGDDAARAIASVYQHLTVPDDWRFVVCRPRKILRGISGTIEQAAFARLPPVPEAVTEHLVSIADELMIPALRNSDLSGFGAAVYEYGKLAGACFAKVQGGPFASSQVATIVQAIRDCGVLGVGQSSWGPTVFAITSDEAAASELRSQLEKRFGPRLRIETAAASRHGMDVVKISTSAAKTH